LRFASLGSGSEGNGLIVESGDARLLVDCGFSLNNCQRRLHRLGLEPKDLSAILVTHEHDDHVGGVFDLARAADIPVFLTHGTRIAGANEFWAGVRTLEVDSHARLEFGDLVLNCFPVPHDAREPAQLVVEDSVSRLGILTDVGRSTQHIESILSCTDALFLEANHDLELLRRSDYPPSLKERIGGPYGHLSNAMSASILEALDQSRLQIVVAAHLSRQNNRPDLVEAALRPVLRSEAALEIASQAEGFDWVALAQ